MISRLFSLVADPHQLDALKLSQVLDWTGAVLNRVDRASFFSNFEESHAVQYFYEPFLEAFDPELRKQLGVWYTPPEIVKYMVERVDTVLRQELGLPLGLADKNVYVLDPCCGTGSYLVEVLDRIHRTLKERGEDALTASDLKGAAQKRVFGFEILPAPFVVSHLQLGLLLQNLGAPLSDKSKERVGVYLTNALTGWEPPKGPKAKMLFSELEEERDLAEEVKREKPILVILGNPPYNAFAGVSPEEELGLVEPYKEGLISEWGIKKFNLDDLYIRFLRLAERRIVDSTGKGIVCYISSYSYLGDPSFVVMRKRFLGEFDRLWFDCMNGDSRETGKLTPEGKPDPSVFSTESNREGIRLGTAITVVVRKPNRERRPQVWFRDFWGANKRADLLQSLDKEDLGRDYQRVSPHRSNRYSFRPLTVTRLYQAWPKVVDFCGVAPISGLQEMRHGGLLDIDREALEDRVRSYFNAEVDWDTLKGLGSGLTREAGGYDPKRCRSKALALEKYDSENIKPYALYPMDSRWCYYTRVPTLWNRPRPELAIHDWHGNNFVTTRMMAERPDEGIPITVTRHLPDYHLLRPNVVAMPTRLRDLPIDTDGNQQGVLIESPRRPSETPKANLSASARAYLANLGSASPDADVETAGLIWMHTLAIGYSPAYLTENADGIHQDWPRIPLPDSKELLLASAALGRKIATLLDTETPFDVGAPLVGAPVGRAQGAPLQKIAVPTRVDGKALDETKDLAVTAGWGHAGKGGVTMPGKGRLIERDYTPEERDIMLGGRTCNVYLNDVAYWRNIPLRVWEYTIGGYQVIKKWLSYREEKLLGRPMTKDEVRWVQEMARRIAAILLMEPALDENYCAIKAHAYQWAEEG
jgi:hypothetical protein